jgi:hypothetical protein
MVETLDDVVPLWPAAVFVDLAPTASAIHLGHHRPSDDDRLWAGLRRTGLLSTTAEGWEDDLAADAGLGIATIVPRPVRYRDALDRQDLELGLIELRTRLAEVLPRLVVFTLAPPVRPADSALVAATWRDGATFVGARVWVLPLDELDDDAVDRELWRLGRDLRC